MVWSLRRWLPPRYRGCQSLCPTQPPPNRRRSQLLPTRTLASFLVERTLVENMTKNNNNSTAVHQYTTQRVLVYIHINACIGICTSSDRSRCRRRRSCNLTRAQACRVLAAVIYCRYILYQQQGELMNYNRMQFTLIYVMKIQVITR